MADVDRALPLRRLHAWPAWLVKRGRGRANRRQQGALSHTAPMSVGPTAVARNDLCLLLREPRAESGDRRPWHLRDNAESRTVPLFVTTSTRGNETERPRTGQRHNERERRQETATIHASLLFTSTLLDPLDPPAALLGWPYRWHGAPWTAHRSERACVSTSLTLALHVLIRCSFVPCASRDEIASALVASQSTSSLILFGPSRLVPCASACFSHTLLPSLLSIRRHSPRHCQCPARETLYIQ